MSHERHARIHDMPAPRATPSMASRLLGRLLSWPYRACLAGLCRIGARPWHLTLASLVSNLVVGALLLGGQRLLPGLLLVPAGALDTFDGSIARLRNEESRLGAFLDSGLDRISDLVLFGCLFWSLSAQGESLEAALALATMGVSLGVSHTRAAAESEGAVLSEGLFQRLERYVALVVGLCVPGALLPVLVILAALGGLTFVQRAWSGTAILARPLPAEGERA